MGMKILWVTVAVAVVVGVVGAAVFLLQHNQTPTLPTTDTKQQATPAQQPAGHDHNHQPASSKSEDPKPSQPIATPVEPVDLKPDPRFIVPSLDMEPVELDDDTVRAQGSTRVAFLPLGGRVHMDVRKVVFPGTVLMQSGLIELFACAEGGKEHESIVRVLCSPVQLNPAVVLGCRLKSGPVPKTPSISEPGQGGRALIMLQWKGKDGKTYTYHAEDLIIDRRTNTLMPRVGWTFVGSRFEPEMDPETGRPTGRFQFVGEQVRSIITTFRDSSTFFDTPLSEGSNDAWFEANYSLLPPPGTAIWVIIRAPTAEEVKVIARNEQEALIRFVHAGVREKRGWLSRAATPEPQPADRNPDAVKKELADEEKRLEGLQGQFEKQYGSRVVLPNE